MTRLLVRAHKHPFRAAEADRVLDRNLFGSNVGNLVFAEAVIRLLSVGVDPVPTSGLIGQHAERINHDYDHVVIPLANAFRPNYLGSLHGLADLIERLRIPVTVVGVGAQAHLKSGKGRHREAVDLDAGVTRFVRAVLDRSPSVGVRGAFTAEYLDRLGFGAEHVDVIGCPSMFMYGPDLPRSRVVDRIDTDSPIALNISPYVAEMGPASLDLAERYPQLVYLPQDLRSLHLLRRGTYPMTSKRVTVDSGVPITLDHPLVAQDRVRFCLDPQTWFEHLRGYAFSFGTRIHGNIAAVLAGTPALVLAHDSRTLELADHHGIPHRLITSLKRIDPIELYEGAEWDTMAARHPGLWGEFAGFLDRHQLDHVYRPGRSAARFDAGLAAADFPEPVTTLMGLDPAALYAMRDELDRLLAWEASRPLRRARQSVAGWIRGR